MLHYAEQNKLQFIKLLQVGRLEDFVEGQPDKIVHTVKDFLSDASEANVLLIRSDIGNGGTHLLSGAANHLLDKGEVICVCHLKYYEGTYRLLRTSCDRTF